MHWGQNLLLIGRLQAPKSGLALQTILKTCRSQHLEHRDRQKFKRCQRKKEMRRLRQKRIYKMLHTHMIQLRHIKMKEHLLRRLSNFAQPMLPSKILTTTKLVAVSVKVRMLLSGLVYIRHSIKKLQSKSMKSSSFLNLIDVKVSSGK